MTSRTWYRRAVAYVLASAVVNVAFSSNLADGSEFFEVLSFAALVLGGEWWSRRRELRSLRRADDAVLRVEACAGPYSLTEWNCNGAPAEVETCSPAGTPLATHLRTHAAAVQAKAEELGCP